MAHLEDKGRRHNFSTSLAYIELDPKGRKNLAMRLRAPLSGIGYKGQEFIHTLRFYRICQYLRSGGRRITNIRAFWAV